MRLVDLEPTWIERPHGRIVGVRFTCPKDDGAGPHHEGHAVCVLFANPPDDGAAHPDDPGCPGNSKGRRWQRSGSTFDDLTLSPSVDCTTSEGCEKSDHSKCSHAHCWHGSVSSGAVT
jgi:hypothetical protein